MTTPAPAPAPAAPAASTQLEQGIIIGPRCHDTGIRGFGSTEHGVMIIGVAPGKDEMKSGKPLTGPTGRLFDTILKAVGWPRSQCYVTNMCCTYIEGKIKHSNMDECNQRLQAEIALVRPRLIITLGTEVCEYWTGYPITKARGAALWNTTHQCYVLPMIQPAALFHSDLDEQVTNVSADRVSNVGYDIIRDLRKINEILAWPQDGSRSHVPYTVCTTTQEAQAVLDNLPLDIPVALDVETNSKMMDIIDIRQDELICLAISTGTYTYVFPTEIIRDAANNTSLVQWPTGVRWTFHNAVFDTAIVKRFLGVWLQVHDDTMLMSYSCDERTGYHGLKPLAREFEGAGFWELDRAKGNRELLYGYNAKDAAYTQRLAAGKLNTWLDEEGTREPYTNLLIPAVNAAKEIQARGARIDARLLEHLEEEWGNERDDEKDKMQDVAKASGWPDSLINLNSPKQLSKLLYQIIGLPGGPSTSKANLDALEGMHPFVDALLEYRHLEHNYKIYLDGFTYQIRRHGSQHGRVHPTVKLHGTVTGRRSYSDPAVQTIPRPSNYANKYGKLRQAFIPTNDDYEIAYVDYSRAEIYTAFGYSQDPVMWNALQKDYHLETAVNVMHKSRERMALDADYREEMRRIAKIVTFGILYGMEDYALSMTAGISVQEARDYIEQFFVTNAQYAKFYRDTLRILERTGEITSLTGRKRRFVLLTPNPRALKQAVNFPIQSTAGDCTLMSLIQLHPMLKQYDSHILFDVHDAIVFEVAKKYRHIVLPLITEVMESPKFPDTHPEFPSIPTEAYIGSSWGHARKIKDIHNLPPPTSIQTRTRQLMVDRKRTFSYTVVA